MFYNTTSTYQLKIYFCIFVSNLDFVLELSIKYLFLQLKKMMIRHWR